MKVRESDCLLASLSPPLAVPIAIIWACRHCLQSGFSGVDDVALFGLEDDGIPGFVLWQQR